MFRIKPSTTTLTHWIHHAEQNSPPQRNILRCLYHSPSHEQQHGTPSTQRQIQKPENFFQNVEMWIFCCLSICLSACNHGSSVCVRKCVQTLAWWCESDCVGMHKSVCVRGCVQGFPQSPSLTAHAGWQMTARALPVSLSAWLSLAAGNTTWEMSGHWHRMALPAYSLSYAHT